MFGLRPVLKLSAAADLRSERGASEQFCQSPLGYLFWRANLRQAIGRVPRRGLSRTDRGWALEFNRRWY